MIVVGLISLIVPGIIWAIKYMFIPLLIVDKGMGVQETMTASDKMTNTINFCPKNSIKKSPVTAQHT